MTADSEKDIQYLKAIGRICAETLRRMMAAARAGGVEERDCRAY